MTGRERQLRRLAGAARDERGAETLEWVAITGLSLILVGVIVLFFVRGGYSDVVSNAVPTIQNTISSFGW